MYRGILVVGLYDPYMSTRSIQYRDDQELPSPIHEAFLLLQPVMGRIVGEGNQPNFSSEIVGNEVFLRVRVHNADDLGKLIGRQGRIARSLRILLHAMTSHHKVTVHLDIDKHVSATRPAE